MGRILEALTQRQERDGWLSEDALRALASELRVPLHRLESLSTFYTHFRREPPRGPVLSVCRDVVCRMAGGLDPELRRALQAEGVEMAEVSCLGRCDAAPAGCAGDHPVALDDAERVRAALREPSAPERPRRAWPAADPYADGLEPYTGLRRALADDGAAALAALEDAGLRGMGGAGFPTARKWSLVREAAPAPGTAKHVVCNGDESEPGTFKDREILNDLPHLVVEGIVLAGLCVGASRGTLFLRHEYAPERRRLEAELARAREHGALGPALFGGGRGFELSIVVSPGGYILGEETALLECLEDRRGEPRNKPPFPGQRGLHGGPTLVNNVETFAHATAIALQGADWWRGLGRGDHAGHKFMAVCGDVARPGVELVPLGTPLRELLEARGGLREGARFGALAPGGASSPWIGAEHLDTPIDFDALAAAGTMLGAGAAVVAAADRDLLEIGLDVTRFFRNESCGKCVPCRVGTEKAVARIEAASREELAGRMAPELARLHYTLERTSLCGLGQVALAPLLSILERFPNGRADG